MLTARSSSPPSMLPPGGDFVSEQELDEEEELVRRAIELSMLDVDPSYDHHHDHHHDHQEHNPVAPFALDTNASAEVHSHSHQPLEWGSGQVVDVDAKADDTQVSHEDQAIVDSILKELQEEEDMEREALNGTESSTPNGARTEDWPSISRAVPTLDLAGTSSLLPSSADAGSTSRSEPVKPQEPAAKKMTWSMVARTNSESSLGPSGPQGNGQGTGDQTTPSGRKPAVFREYSQSASQEEIEDEETQLARILSLSMVEK